MRLSRSLRLLTDQVGHFLRVGGVFPLGAHPFGSMSLWRCACLFVLLGLVHSTEEIPLSIDSGGGIILADRHHRFYPNEEVSFKLSPRKNERFKSVQVNCSCMKPDLKNGEISLLLRAPSAPGDYSVMIRAALSGAAEDKQYEGRIAYSVFDPIVIENVENVRGSMQTRWSIKLEDSIELELDCFVGFTKVEFIKREKMLNIIGDYSQIPGNFYGRYVGSVCLRFYRTGETRRSGRRIISTSLHGSPAGNGINSLPIVLEDEKNLRVRMGDILTGSEFFGKKVRLSVVGLKGESTAAVDAVVGEAPIEINLEQIGKAGVKSTTLRIESAAEPKKTIYVPIIFRNAHIPLGH